MNTGVGCHFLLQGIFLTQGLNPGLPHCRQMLYHLSYQGRTSICKWALFNWLKEKFSSVQFSRSVMSDSLWPHWVQHALSITNSWSLLKLMSIESVMPSNHLILCRPLLLLPLIFPSIRIFSNESVPPIKWPKFGASVSASVLPMNIQDWFTLGWTGWISLQCKGLSRLFSNTTV